MNVFFSRNRVLRAVAIPMILASLGSARLAAPAVRPRARVMDLHAQNEPIRQVPLRLARGTGADVTIGDGVAGYVTVELHKVTLVQALHAILDPIGATFQGAVAVYAGTAFLFSGAVLSQYRRRGAHRALLHARTTFAATRDATRTTIKTVVGSDAERSVAGAGFDQAVLLHRVRS